MPRKAPPDRGNGQTPDVLNSRIPKPRILKPAFPRSISDHSFPDRPGVSPATIGKKENPALAEAKAGIMVRAGAPGIGQACADDRDRSTPPSKCAISKRSIVGQVFWLTGKSLKTEPRLPPQGRKQATQANGICGVRPRSTAAGPREVYTTFLFYVQKQIGHRRSHHIHLSKALVYLCTRMSHFVKEKKTRRPSQSNPSGLLMTTK